jgi:hypothetical protein
MCHFSKNSFFFQRKQEQNDTTHWRERERERERMKRFVTYFVEAINDKETFNFVHLDLFTCRCKWCIKPLFKVRTGVENVGQQKVQQ